MTFRSRFRPQSGWNCPETTGPRWTAALCLSQREKKEGTISSRRHGNPPMPRFSSLHLNSKCHQRTFWRLIYIFFFIEFDPSSDGIQSSGSSSQWAPCQPQHRDCLENTWLSAVAAHIDSVSFSGQSSSLFFSVFFGLSSSNRLERDRAPSNDCVTNYTQTRTSHSSNDSHYLCQ